MRSGFAGKWCGRIVSCFVNGLRVLNTRAVAQSDELDKAIHAAGGISINLPAFTITATSLDWLNQMPALTTINQAVFVSPNAVNYYFSALKQANITWPASIIVIAVGHATANMLLKQDIYVHHIPLVANSENLLELDTFKAIQHQHILLIKGIGGRSLIEEELQLRGACLTPLAVYRRDLPDLKQEYINSMWQDDVVDIILFTSQQAISNLFTLFPEEGRFWIRNKPCLVISARLAEIASEFGIRTIIISQYDKIIDALNHYNQGALHGQHP